MRLIFKGRFGLRAASIKKDDTGNPDLKYLHISVKTIENSFGLHHRFAAEVLLCYFEYQTIDSNQLKIMNIPNSNKYFN